MPNIYVKAYGCSSNQADAEITRGMLTWTGHTITNTPEDADAYIILSCIVKTPTQQKITKHIKQLQETQKPLIIAGCMPKAMQDHIEETVPSASLVGPDDLEHMSEALERALMGERVVYIDGEPTDRTCLPRVRGNKLVLIEPISSGCLGNCAYCVVKFARGHLYSFSADQIVQDIKMGLDDGVKEVWITAEDTAAYDYEGVRLPELLNRITGLPGDFRVRVGMTTPNQVLSIIDDLIESYRDQKIFKFIHIPIQSGNDVVLQNMNRRYSVGEFKELVIRLREAFPDIGISTDIICGFPGESEEQYQDSLDLVQWLRPDVLNISRYWERPGTEAVEMEGKIHGRITKERSRVLTRQWKVLAIDVGKKWMGWEGEILLDELGKRGSKVGRNFAYKAIAVRTDVPLGEYVRVRVKKAGVGFLVADES